MIGWIGNHKRPCKQFELAQSLPIDMQVAGHRFSEFFISHDKIVDFYNSVNIILITSNFESKPITAYEALATETPVVIHKDVGDLRRVDAKGVVFYDEFSKESIMKSINYALKNRNELGKTGRKFIEENFSWEIIGQQYINTFKRYSNKENPEVLFIADVRNWAYDFIGKDIQRLVYPVDIHYSQEDPMIDMSEYDIILNNDWHRFRIPEYDNKTIYSINGPEVKQEELIAELSVKSLSLATVSLVIKERIKNRLGITVDYLTRGIDINKFKKE